MYITAIFSSREKNSMQIIHAYVIAPGLLSLALAGGLTYILAAIATVVGNEVFGRKE